MKPLKVYRDVSTRWNSTCTMLERAIHLREPISRLMMRQDYPSDQVMIPQEWDQASFIIHFLLCFKRCADRLQATKRPELHKVWWAYDTMFNEIDDMKEGMASHNYAEWAPQLSSATEAMEASLRQYYEATKLSPVYVDVTILNLRTKLSLFKTETWEEYWAANYMQECGDQF